MMIIYSYRKLVFEDGDAFYRYYMTNGSKTIWSDHTILNPIWWIPDLTKSASRHWKQVFEDDAIKHLETPFTSEQKRIWARYQGVVDSPSTFAAAVVALTKQPNPFELYFD